MLTNRQTCENIFFFGNSVAHFIYPATGAMRKSRHSISSNNEHLCTSNIKFVQQILRMSYGIGYLDDQGILYITDRKKDMIIMSGWKIYPTEVENVIIQHPAIADVAVFGVPDERKGEVPVAAVVLKQGISLTPSELESYCRVHLAGYKIPRTRKIVSSLPRVH
jgi:acyl-coenzyme A synthetase/AMP-(fatty) acid ligase